tara:strand:- start:176 stop:415 length:240 start_codon:yes stop_codon:yes gene_type:complete
VFDVGAFVVVVVTAVLMGFFLFVVRPVQLSIGGPALLFAPISLYVMHKWIVESAQYGTIRYQRVGLDDPEAPVEFGLGD